jgi:hypothetical protein
LTAIGWGANECRRAIVRNRVLPREQSRLRRRVDQRSHRVDRALMQRLIDLHQEMLLGDVDGFDRRRGDDDVARLSGSALAISSPPPSVPIPGTHIIGLVL